MPYLQIIIKLWYTDVFEIQKKKKTITSNIEFRKIENYFSPATCFGLKKKNLKNT